MGLDNGAMIGEREIYHGVVLSRLVQRGDQRIMVESLSTVSRSAYLLNEKTVMYVKYSTKRLAPWAFEFTAEHAEEIEGLRFIFDDLWVVLVCGPVGIASAAWSHVEELISRRADGGYSLYVNWRPNHKFRVSGAGSEPLLVADNAFPVSIVSS